MYLEALETCTQFATNYVEGIPYPYCVNWQPLPHLTAATNLAGYISWGAHSGLGPTYPTNGIPQWFGNSGWWIIETIESFNGTRGDPGQGTFLKWFSANAFGSTDYLNTPVGAVTHVAEPVGGPNSPDVYFRLWAQGAVFAKCAWLSRNTPYFQAVGDPFVTR